MREGASAQAADGGIETATAGFIRRDDFGGGLVGAALVNTGVSALQWNGIGKTVLFIFLAPIAALLIQLAVSRQREYEADHTGAELTGNPYGLAHALEKLEASSKRVPLQASPSTAHLFIVKPFSGGGLMEWFSTHPPIEKRIERLLGRPWA